MLLEQMQKEEEKHFLVMASRCIKMVDRIVLIKINFSRVK